MTRLTTNYTLENQNGFLKIVFTRYDYASIYIPMNQVYLKTIKNSDIYFQIITKNQEQMFDYTYCTNISGTDIYDFISNLGSLFTNAPIGNIGITNTVERTITGTVDINTVNSD
jgi:hypothetical protein